MGPSLNTISRWGTPRALGPVGALFVNGSCNAVHPQLGEAIELGVAELLDLDAKTILKPLSSKVPMAP